MNENDELSVNGNSAGNFSLLPLRSLSIRLSETFLLGLISLAGFTSGNSEENVFFQFFGGKINLFLAFRRLAVSEGQPFARSVARSHILTAILRVSFRSRGYSFSLMNVRFIVEHLVRKDRLGRKLNCVPSKLSRMPLFTHTYFPSDKGRKRQRVERRDPMNVTQEKCKENTPPRRNKE